MIWMILAIAPIVIALTVLLFNDDWRWAIGMTALTLVCCTAPVLLFFYGAAEVGWIK